MLHAAITLFFAVAGWLCHIPVLDWLLPVCVALLAEAV